MSTGLRGLREHTATRRFQLRQSTSDAHAALDDLVGPLRSRADYRRYLIGIAGFRLAVEPVLDSFALRSFAGRWRPTRIASALREDLADLGMSGVGFSDVTPRIGSVDEFLGCAYVLEGSALGARVLLKRALELGLDADHGARHLAIQAGALDNWRNLVVLLDSAEPFNIEVAKGGAAAAFGTAKSAFLNLADV